MSPDFNTPYIYVGIAVASVACASAAALIWFLSGSLKDMNFYNSKKKDSPLNGKEYEPELKMFLGEYEIRSLIKDWHAYFAGAQNTQQKVSSKNDDIVILVSIPFWGILIYGLCSSAWPLPIIVDLLMVSIIVVSTIISGLHMGFVTIARSPTEAGCDYAVYNFMSQLYMLAALLFVGSVGMVTFNMISSIAMPLISPYALYVFVGASTMLLATRISDVVSAVLLSVPCMAGSFYLASQCLSYFVFAPQLLVIIFSACIGLLSLRPALMVVNALIKLTIKILLKYNSGAVISIMPHLLQELGEEKQKELVRSDVSLLHRASDGVGDDKYIMLDAVKKSGDLLHYASDKVRNDKGVSLAAVCQNGLAYQFVGSSLEDDHEIVFEAFLQRKKAGDGDVYGKEPAIYNCLESKVDRLLPDMSITLQEKFVLEARKIPTSQDVSIALVNKDAFLLEHLGYSVWRRSQPVVLAAVKKDGWAIEFAHVDLYNNKEIVLAATRQILESGDLQFFNRREGLVHPFECARFSVLADEELQEIMGSDKERILQAVFKKDIRTCGAHARREYSSHVIDSVMQSFTLPEQEAFCSEVPSLLDSADYELQKKLIIEDPERIGCLRDANRKKIIHHCLENIGYSIWLQGHYGLDCDPPEDRCKYTKVICYVLSTYYIPSLCDKDLMIAVVKKFAMTFQSAIAHLREDRDVVLAAASRDDWVMHEAGASWFRGDRDVMLSAVSRNGFVLAYAGNDLQNDNKILQAAFDAIKKDYADFRMFLNSRKEYYELLYQGDSCEKSMTCERFVYRGLSDDIENKGNFAIKYYLGSCYNSDYRKDEGLRKKYLSIYEGAKAKASKRLITAIRSNAQMLKELRDKAGKLTTCNTLTINQKLLRESIIAEVFCGAPRLYQIIKKLMKGVIVLDGKGNTIKKLPALSRDGINNILRFILPSYIPGDINIAYHIGPAQSSDINFPKESAGKSGVRKIPNNTSSMVPPT